MYTNSLLTTVCAGAAALFAGAVALAADTSSHVKVETSKGDFVIALKPDEAPKTVENFLEYVEAGHYQRTIFHRVVGGFVVQGGGYSRYFIERATQPPIPYEGDNGLKNDRGTIAMARTRDPNSASAQWYINLRDNDRLNHLVNDIGVRPGYAVFGEVVAGMEVVDAIGAIPTGPGGPFPSQVPEEEVLILSAEVVEWSPAERASE